MQKNVGNLDAFIRIWAGLLMLGLGINRDSISMMTIGACKVAEGVTRFCPIFYILGISTSKKIEFNKALIREERRDRTPEAQY